MNIAERIESAVGEILPTYGYTPEFTDDNEPERYIIYDITENGTDYSEGENRVNQYMASLNVFTPSLDFALYEQLKSAMYAAGFCYDSGGKTGTDALFPYITHYYLDFVGVEERG